MKKLKPGYVVFDLKSKNGTAVNCRPIVENLLKEGMTVKFGDVEFVFRAASQCGGELTVGATQRLPFITSSVLWNHRLLRTEDLPLSPSSPTSSMCAISSLMFVNTWTLNLRRYR